ncbi:latrophilin receptor-like protein A isoform X2 [Watersipora subatra]|uniref:latrophilin receptor-like protein A isoform X2 n=1 Tax=Watersipora subatra TaxID=2589382 RepID=UPI00355B5E28
MIDIETTTNYTEPSYCGLEEGQCDTIRQIKEGIMGLTIIVTIVTVICIILLGKYKLFIERIICHLVVSSLISAIATISRDGKPEKEGETFCILQAFFIQIFDFAEFMWCLNFTIFLWILIFKERDTSNYEWVYTLLTWIVNLALACIPFGFKGAYGPASAPFCWISDEHQILRYILFWIPVFSGLVMMVIAFISMIFRARKRLQVFQGPCSSSSFTTSKNTKLIETYLKPLTVYFILFVIINIVQLANRIQNIVDGEPMFVLTIFHIISISLYARVAPYQVEPTELTGTFA